MDGKGCGIREEAALGDEYPRQAAAKVEWARARGVWWKGFGFRVFLGSEHYSPRGTWVVCEGGLCRGLIEWALDRGAEANRNDLHEIARERGACVSLRVVFVVL